MDQFSHTWATRSVVLVLTKDVLWARSTTPHISQLRITISVENFWRHSIHSSPSIYHMDRFQLGWQVKAIVHIPNVFQSRMEKTLNKLRRMIGSMFPVRPIGLVPVDDHRRLCKHLVQRSGHYLHIFGAVNLSISICLLSQNVIIAYWHQPYYGSLVAPFQTAMDIMSRV